MDFIYGVGKFPELSVDLLEGRSQFLRSRLDLSLGECHSQMVPNLLPDSRLLRAEARTRRGSKRVHQRPWLDMIMLFFGFQKGIPEKLLLTLQMSLN